MVKYKAYKTSRRQCTYESCRCRRTPGLESGSTSREGVVGVRRTETTDRAETSVASKK